MSRLSSSATRVYADRIKLASKLYRLVVIDAANISCETFIDAEALLHICVLHSDSEITMSGLRSPVAILQYINLAALGGMTLYFKSHHDYNLQEHEARMDELEGTLRGHIGLIEDALERLEGKKIDGKSQKAFVDAASS